MSYTRNPDIAGGDALTEEQASAVIQLVSGTITSCVYNATSGRLESYSASGIAHTITWVGDVGTIANSTGAPSRVITLNASGQVVSFV